MARVEDSIEIDASVESVWQVTIDVERWPDHTSTMSDVERLDSGSLAIGSSARIKQPAQRARTWTVSVLEPNRRFAWTARALGTTMTATHVLAATPTGTRNTLIVDIDGKLAPVVGALISSPIRKAIATENLGIKTAAEGLGVS